MQSDKRLANFVTYLYSQAASCVKNWWQNVAFFERQLHILDVNCFNIKIFKLLFVIF